MVKNEIFVFAVFVLLFAVVPFACAATSFSSAAVANNTLTRVFYAGEALSFNAEDGRHTLVVLWVKDGSVALTISGAPQKALMSAGEERTFDLTGDGAGDISVRMNGIAASGKGANMTIGVTSGSGGAISAEAALTPVPSEENNESIIGDLVEMETVGESSNVWIGVVVGAIVVLLVIYLIIRVANKKRTAF